MMAILVAAAILLLAGLLVMVQANPVDASRSRSVFEVLMLSSMCCYFVFAFGYRRKRKRVGWPEQILDRRLA
jgi:uncharacterized membrane protein